MDGIEYYCAKNVKCNREQCALQHFKKIEKLKYNAGCIFYYDEIQNEITRFAGLEELILGMNAWIN